MSAVDSEANIATDEDIGHLPRGREQGRSRVFVAEGATAPETLRQTDRARKAALESAGHYA